MEITSRIGNATSLGVVIQQARHARGLTQRDLAAQLGVPLQLMSNLENGRPTKALDRLFATLRELEVSLIAEFQDDQLTFEESVTGA